MDFFTTTSQGLIANIKAQPEHFQVTEISYFENSCHMNKDTVHNQSCKRKSNLTLDTDLCNSKKVKEEISQKYESGSHTDKERTEEFHCDIKWCREKLHSILHESMVRKLKNMAKIELPQKIDKPDSQHSGDREALEPESLCLGVYSDKSLRSVIHKCVRYAFPQLKTSTIPGMESITVQLCDIHKDFTGHLDRKLVNELIRYITVETLYEQSKLFTIKGCDSKEHRRHLHHMINKYWGKIFETKTKTDESNNASIIIRRKRQAAGGARYQSSCITSFKLWKFNTETQAAIQQLSRHFSLRPHMFHFAGTKDKRAITVQTITVASISPIKVLELGKTLPENLKVFDARLVPRHVRLGELVGNKFVIILSNVNCLPSHGSKMKNVRTLIDEALGDVVKHGFVNLFGPQRFGRHIFDASEIGDLKYLDAVKQEAPAIGLAMLSKDFRKAVTILLRPNNPPVSEIETSAADAAKTHFLETGDVQGAINRMPSHKTREIAVLKALRRFGTSDQDSYAKAVLSLPYQVRLFYIHSYCSWIWNRMATLRLIRYGCRVCEGDLILSDKLSADSTDKMEKVVAVTSQDVASNIIGLQDIVLPTPGNQIRYPPNMTHDYSELMHKHCITADEHSKECVAMEDCDNLLTTNFRIPELKLNIPGAYRRLIEYPRNLSHRHLEIQAMDSVKLPSTRGSMVESSTPSNDVELIFDLAPSSYATALLHEITKGNCF